MNGRKREKSAFIGYFCRKSGDGQALGAVLNHYQRYIRSLATRTLTDECGNKVYYVDEEIRLRLEARLIYCIVADFKILPV